MPRAEGIFLSFNFIDPTDLSTTELSAYVDAFANLSIELITRHLEPGRLLGL
jgi:hypothetical protein